MIVTIAIVIVSVAVLLIAGVASSIAGACWGAILGPCIGGVSGGLESFANGGSFLEGFEDGALSVSYTHLFSIQCLLTISEICIC